MHLEPTTRCTLHCPACPRTVISNKLGHFYKQDLVVEDLVRFLDCEAGATVSNFNLEGNHGDPIYYNKLFDLIDQFRDTKNFNIVTNGSYKDEKFWHNLASRLTKEDYVVFSIDGLEHNNHLYRRNSDWATTIQGVKIISQYPVRLGWKTLIFDYNYQEIDQIQNYAESLGARFVAEKTARFVDETLRPPQHLLDHTRDYQNRDTKINPQCANNRQEYISADGYYWPCCWVSSAFTLYKSDLWKNRSQWSIQNQNLDQARLQLKNWIEDMPNRPADTVCQMMCKSSNPDYLDRHGLT